MAYTYTGTLNAASTGYGLETGIQCTTAHANCDAIHVSSTASGSNAISATCNQSNACAIYAVTTNGGVGVGAYSDTTTSGYGAVQAINTSSGNGLYASSNGGNGVHAQGGTAVWGEGTGIGVYGTGYTAVLGDGDSTGVWGATYGETSDCTGVNAYASGSAYGIYCAGLSYFSGWVSKPAGSFLIDHPLDPTNKDLAHSFVESPDMKNVYDGVGIADRAGELEVQMPAYFDALNKDFRYQLTALGGPAPDLHVKEELRAGRFVIAGAKPAQRVSWQLTGIRKDAFAEANRLVVEPEKKDYEKGLYRQPEAYGKPRSEGIDWKRGEKMRNAKAKAKATPAKAP